MPSYDRSDGPLTAIRHTRLRDNACDLAAVRCAYLKPQAEAWRTISTAHVQSAWAAVDAAVEDVMKEVCGTRSRLSHGMV